MAQLDALDRKILFALDCNSRESHASLAQRLRIPQETVRYRIRRLQERGVILDFLTLIDTGKLGNSYYKILLKLRNVNEERVRELIATLSGNDAVNWIARLDGLYDVGFTIRVGRVLELSEFLDHLKAENVRFIHRLSFAVNIQVDFLSRDYLLGRKKRREPRGSYTAPESELEIDDTDKRLLRLIATDTRRSSASLARSVEMSTEGVLQRLKKLQERRVIVRYLTTLHCESAELYNYYVLLYLNNVAQERIEAFRSYCLEHPNVIYLIKALGEWDYELNIEVEETVEYRKLMMDLTRLFSDIIRDYYTLTVLELHKFTLAPE